jgi:CHAT domain-containing protein
MKILFRFFLIIFSLSFFACKQDTAAHNQTKLTPKLPDSILLHQADSIYDLAEKITDLKKSDSALSLHQRVLAIREKLLTNDIHLVNSYYKVGMLYFIDNKYDVADKYLENARRIAEDTNAPFSTVYDIYINLASCKIEAKDFSTAISIVDRLLRLLKEQDDESKDKIANAYVKLANIYHYQNQEKMAIEIWLQATKLIPGDHPFLGRIYYSLSVAHAALKQPKLSLFYINRSIDQDLIWAGPESKSIADKYLHKAFALLELQMDSVTYYLHRTLRIRKNIFGEKHSYTYGVKRALGDFYYRIHRYDSAVYYHHESLISLIRKFNNHNFFSSPGPEQDEINPDLTQSLVRKAEAVERLSENDPLKRQLLNLSLNTFLLADSVFASYRRNILHDDPLLRQMQGKMIPYPEMVSITSKLLKQKKSIDYFERAFHVMESSRAIVLQNALNRAIAFGSVGIPDTILNKEKGFSRIRAELLQKMNDPTLLQSLRDSLYEELLLANNREIDLQNELKKVNQNYFSVRYDNLPTINELRKFLAEQNSVYLEYMWSDSTIYALMIFKDTIRLNSIPVNEKFRKVFNGYTNEFRGDPEGAIGLDRYKKFCSNASLLYDYLAKGLLDDIDPKSHLIISVDGPLATIPFDALITRDPGGNEVNYDLPYLVLKRPISYAYSAGVLLNQLTHSREGKKLLAFGYAGGGPARATRSGLTNLPGTEKEILAIKDVMQNHVNQYKLQGEASESFFKKQVPDFDIVHLAVHGEGDTLNALNSRLIFRSETDTVEDGSLYAHELYDLNLSKLDLAVLSACESGVGKQQPGEGLMSIARGFAYAGCPSLVISLWKINDRTSAQVMKSFYKYLSDGEPLDVSLANAKTDYIKGAGEFNSHPFYWAAFLQVGDVRALDVKKPNWWGWVLVGLGAAFLFILVKRWRH